MPEPTQPSAPPPPDTSWGPRDDLASRFWSLWRQGQEPNVADFLAAAGTRDPDEVLAVLRVDQTERFRLGQSVRVETYLDAVPALRDYRDQVLDLIFAEYLLREENGERPAPEEYLRRFPHYAQEVKLQLELNQALGPLSQLPSSPTHVITTRIDRGPVESGGGSAGLLEIPGFTVLGVLGRGGMGVVYRAWQHHLNRSVAIKMVHAGAQASPAMLARFRVEAEAVARLRHPHIVQIHDVGQQAGSPYLVLELVEGRNLAQRVSGTPQPVAWAAGLLETLARAIHAAHEQGVVHRDLTPANVLLTAEGIPKITDFGLAKLIKGGGELRTQTGELLGTPSYMAPEQAASRHHAIGVATDVYALGAILYELLTGRPPFKAESPIETLRQVVSDEPVAPSRLRPKLPRDMETLCLKCLRKEPAQRYASSLALAEDLRRFQDGRPILARRSTSSERAWRWCRRNPWLAAANVAALLLTLILAIGSTVAAWIYRDQRDDIQLEQERTKISLHLAGRAQREAHLELGKSLLAEGAALARSGLLGRRFDSLDRLARAAPVLRVDAQGRARLPELRDHAIAAMGLTDLGGRRQRKIGAVMSAACDPELARYAVVEVSSRQPVVRRLDDERELFRVPRLQESFWSAFPNFSPDGQYLLVQYFLADVGEPNGLLEVWHLETRERIVHQLVRSVAYAFHPDGRRLVFAPPGKELVVWDLVACRAVERLPLDFPPGDLAFDPPGQRIAAAAAAPPLQVQIRTLDTGRVLAAWTDQVGHAPMSWSHDGRLLAIGHADGRVFVWDVERGRLASVLQGHANLVVRCRFAPAGHLLATSSWDGNMRLWDAAAGEPLFSAPGAEPHFSRDGRRLAFAAGTTLEIYDVAHGQELRTLNPGLIGNRTEATLLNWVHAARFSPDGRLLALAARAGVRLDDASSGRELAWLNTGGCNTILFDQDGRHLITYGDRGLFRWPIRRDPDGGAEALRVGPPELLEEATPARQWYQATWLPDHRTLAMIDNFNARVLLVDATHPRRASIGVRSLSSGSNHRMTSIAVSPDGRWAAAGGWKEAGICIWDLPRRRLERILPPADGEGETSTFVAFSPDGRWLVSCSQNQVAPGFYFWEVGTWKRGPLVALPGPSGVGAPVFSSDGRLAALSVSAQQIRLAETATFGGVAHLTTLEPLAATPLAFSPDGTKLVAATNRRNALLWDLRRIRARLGTMDLDWDQPSFPPEEETLTTIRPSIRVVGEVLEPLTRRAADLATLNQRLQAHPDDADALFERGAMMLGALRWAEAIADMEQGLRLRPDDPDSELRLAEAYLHTDRLRSARTSLDRHLARSPRDLDALLLRGLVALRLGQSQAAADDFSSVLAADPEHELARDRRARAWLALGRSQDALADLDELIRRHPRDASFVELRGEVQERLGHDEAARADRERAAGLLQPTARALNDAAWDLAKGAVYLRDPERAVSLARKAVALAPGEVLYLNTLGVALYRAGRYPDAIATLQQSLAASRGRYAAFDLFFLAMARHRLGQTVQARESFDRAVRWWGEQQQLLEQYAQELAGFRAEAEAVLAGPSGELPEDVFARQR
jgi:serine/threonine protein kinase/WD40 repeat protein/predicted Zn-dependent protease